MAFICFFKRYFGCGPFLKSLLNLLQCCFCFMFWFFGLGACGILAPQPGIKPIPPALEGEVLTTGPPGESQKMVYKRHTKEHWLSVRVKQIGWTNFPADNNYKIWAKYFFFLKQLFKDTGGWPKQADTAREPTLERPLSDWLVTLAFAWWHTPVHKCLGGRKHQPGHLEVSEERDRKSVV